METLITIVIGACAFYIITLPIIWDINNKAGLIYTLKEKISLVLIWIGFFALMIILLKR